MIEYYIHDIYIIDIILHKNGRKKYDSNKARKREKSRNCERY